MKVDNHNKNIIVEECIIKLADGELVAMDLLYDTIKADIYAFAISKVHSKFDADDILQETFIRIYENAKLYTPLGKPLSWIFTIEMNVINRYFQISNKHNVIRDYDIVNNVMDKQLSSEEKIIQNEKINNLLANLDESEVEIIVLHIVSNLKFREIAKQLNKPLSTVLSKYNRAMKKLNKIIEEDD